MNRRRSETKISTFELGSLRIEEINVEVNFFDLFNHYQNSDSSSNYLRYNGYLNVLVAISR